MIWEATLESKASEPLTNCSKKKKKTTMMMMMMIWEKRVLKSRFGSRNGREKEVLGC